MSPGKIYASLLSLICFYPKNYLSFFYEVVACTPKYQVTLHSNCMVFEIK